MKSKTELREEIEEIYHLVSRRFRNQGLSDQAAATIAAAVVLGSILSGIEASLDNIHNCM